MASSKTWVLRPLLAAGAMALWTVLFVTPAKADPPILTATLLPNATDGAGFGTALLGKTSNLTVTMTPAAGYTIQSLAARSDGKVLWQAQTQTPALWTFVVQGIARDDDHSVNFFGNLAPTTTGSGSGKVTTDFAVADLRLPFHEITRSDGSGLTLPASIVVNTPPGQFPQALPPNVGYAATFTIIPHWGGPSGNVGNVVFQVGNGVAVYYQGTRAGGAGPGNNTNVTVTSAGLTNAPLLILTDQTFVGPVTVTATFNWDSPKQAPASALTATDYMNILSYPPIVICAVSFSGTGYNEMYKNSSQAYDPTTMTFSDNGTPPANSVGWLLPGYIQTWHSIMPPAIPQGEIAERDPVCFNGNTTRNVSVLAYLPPTQSPPANLRVVGNVVATTPFGTQVMCQANPFSPGSFALLQANMTGPIPTGVQNLTQTFQWYYDFNAPNPTAPNLQANTTNHQLFVTLSSPQGPAITPQYPPVGGVPVIPGTVTAKRMDWATSTAWNAIQSFSVDGVTYCPGGYPQGATTITTAAEKFMYAIARSPSWRATGRVMTNSIAPWPFLDRKQPGDCVTLATLASAGLNMVGVPAGPCRAFPTADGSGTRDGSGNLIGNANVLSIAAKSGTPSCTSVTTTTFNFNGVAGFKARLQYRGGNEFEGFFTVQDPTGHTKAYTVYAPNSPGPSVPPFDNQDYYFLQVLTSAALPDNQYWVWDGSQKIGGFQVFDGTSVPTGFLDAVIPRALTIPVPPIPTTPNL